MPSGIGEDQYVPWTLEQNICVGLIERDFEDFGIRMSKHQGIYSSSSRANRACGLIPIWVHWQS